MEKVNNEMSGKAKPSLMRKIIDKIRAMASMSDPPLNEGERQAIIFLCERNSPYKPQPDAMLGGKYICNCGNLCKRPDDYCNNCGQKLDWGEQIDR